MRPECDCPRADSELWLPVRGFEGSYLVSDHGRVVSTFNGRRRLRSTKPGQKGYPRVTLSAAGSTYHRNVHSLVTDAFLGPRPTELVVRHLDGTQTNNHLTNLAYGTQKENQRDRLVHGRNNNANKTHCPSGHQYDYLNTSWTREGHRKCRTCARLAMRVKAAAAKSVRQAVAA